MHFKVLYVKENISIEKLLETNNSKAIYSNIEEEFILKYSSVLETNEPSVRNVCDYCGICVEVISASNGIKYDNRKKGDLYMIANLKDLSDDYINTIKDKIYAIALEYKPNKRKINRYYEYDEKEFDDYIIKIKNRQTDGICVVVDCHD